MPQNQLEEYWNEFDGLASEDLSEILAEVTTESLYEKTKNLGDDEILNVTVKEVQTMA